MSKPLPTFGVVSEQPMHDDDRLAPPDLRATFEQALELAWRWRWRAMVCIAGALVIGFGYLLFATERFTTSSVLIVGFRQPELVTPEQGRDVARIEPDIDGAIELMKSQTAMSHVAMKLASQGFTQFQAEGPQQARPLLSRLRSSIAQWLGRETKQPSQRPASDPYSRRISELRKGYKIERIGRSTLVNIAFTSTDPALAAQAANDLAIFSAEDQSSSSRMSLSEQSGFQLVRTSVVSAATVPEEPSSPNTGIVLAAALALGLAAAATAMLYSEFRAQQFVRGTDGLTRRGIRPLGLVPTFSKNDKPSDGGNDSITALQATLARLLARKGGGLVLLVTSALPGEGKSTISAGLARSIAATGRELLLVDADMRSPELHRMLGKSPAPGLATCIEQGRHCVDAVQRGPGARLSFLAAGDCGSRPFELLASPRLRDIIDEWRRSYDVVIIDSSSILGFGDTRVLAGLADYSIVVAQWGKTPWSALSQALDMLSESGGHAAGVVVSRADTAELTKFGVGTTRRKAGPAVA